MGVGYGSVAQLERAGLRRPSVMRAAMAVAGAGSLALLALIALSSAGSFPTALYGWEPQVTEEWQRAISPSVVQLAGRAPADVSQVSVDAPAVQGLGLARSSYIQKLGSTARTLEQQEKDLQAKQLKIQQEKEDVQHLYDAAVKAREENKLRRAEEERTAQQAAATESALQHGLSWMPEMGTDISFIKTAQFPGSMKGAWHHNAPVANTQPPPSLRASSSAGAPEDAAALQLAVKEKVDLDAAKAEIKNLKDKLARGAGSTGASAAASGKQETRTEHQARAVGGGAKKQRNKPQQLRMVRMKQGSSKRGQVDPFKRALKRFLGDASFVGLKPITLHPLTLHPANSRASATAAAAVGRGPAATAGGVGAVVRGHQKSLFDYNMDSQAEPGEHVWPYKGGATMGGPCSVPNACSHHTEGEPHFNLQDDEFHAKRLEQRFNEAEEEEEPEEVVNLGDSQVGGSLDDYVPPEDAYVHNLLTSSAPGLDHFGHLAPLSKSNVELMYGPAYHTLEENMFGHKLHSDGRGGLSSTQAEEDAAAAEEDADGVFYHEHRPAVELGDDQIGGEDEEIPTALTMPEFPGADPDHFDHWAHDDPKNMELLNGAYWKYLKKDGVLDRLTPATEAYKQQSAASHDRTLADTWGSVPHYYGFETAGGFEEARRNAQGDDWRDQVFTGTDESMEDHKGTHGSDTEYFKGKQPTVLTKSQPAA